MHFKSSGEFTSGERILWNALQHAYPDGDDEGKAYHKFPITRDNANSYEPDILIVSKDHGVLIIEVKDMLIDNIQEIDGYEWYMVNWHKAIEKPFIQAKDKHMFSLKQRVGSSRSGVLINDQGDLVVPFNYLVCLPYIEESMWLSKLGVHHDNTKIIFSDQLDPDQVKERLRSLPYRKSPMTPEQFREVLRIITGSTAITRNPGAPIADTSSRGYYLRECRKSINLLDDRQVDVAYCIPPSPQRIRGLAGSGKTVVLAAKIAYMKSKNPDWKILCTYSTRSLKNAFTDLVRKFLHQINSSYSENSPLPEGITITHERDVYSRVGTMLGLDIYPTFESQKNRFNTQDFRLLIKCLYENLLNQIDRKQIDPSYYDAIVIDELQDFPPAFTRFCYRICKQPRIILGQDEMQQISGSLVLPDATLLFGYDDSSNPLVNFDGYFPDDTKKDYMLQSCYRTPRPILVTAHVYGMGLLRHEGALQFVDNKSFWIDLGYQLEGCDAEKIPFGSQITLRRPRTYSPHKLEDFVPYPDIIRTKCFDTSADEYQWIAKQVVNDIQNHKIEPHFITIIVIDVYRSSKLVPLLVNALEAEGVQVFNGNQFRDHFYRSGCVTVTNINRAKGNESSSVYIAGIEFSDDVLHTSEAIKRRNIAFTAFTRSTGFLTITGAGDFADKLIGEIDRINSSRAEVTFEAPNMEQIQRSLEIEEYQRNREKYKEVDQGISNLVSALEDVSLDRLDQKSLDKLRLILGIPNPSNTLE
jgi:superfamily I DNA and RNA helicase